MHSMTPQSHHPTMVRQRQAHPCKLCFAATCRFSPAGKQQQQLFGSDDEGGSDDDADLGIGSDDDFGGSDGGSSDEGEEGSDDDEDSGSGMSDDEDEQLAIEKHNKLLEKAR